MRRHDLGRPTHVVGKRPRSIDVGERSLKKSALFVRRDESIYLLRFLAVSEAFALGFQLRELDLVTRPPGVPPRESVCSTLPESLPEGTVV